jgi:hypothetical protein
MFMSNGLCEMQQELEESVSSSQDQETRLQEAFQYLDELYREGKLTAKQMDVLIKWADDEIENGFPMYEVVNNLKRAKKRQHIYTLAQLNESKPAEVTPPTAPRMSKRGNTLAESMYVYEGGNQNLH